MAVLPMVALGFGLIGLGVLTAWLLRRIPQRPAVVQADILKAVARRTAILRGIGVTIGVIGGIVVAQTGDLGIGLLVAAPLFGLCTLVGVLSGELAVRPPRGPTRTAAIEVRRIRDYLPPRLNGVVTAAGGALLILLAVTTAAGGPDDMGRPGRSLDRQCTSDTFESHGPWPGLFYTGRLIVVVLVGLLMAYAAMHTIVRRPRSGNTGDLAADDALRKHAARAVTAAVGILVAIPLAGVSLTAAGGLLRISCAPAWWTVAGWGLLALVPASLAVVGWCAVAVLTPMNRADSLVRTP